MLEQGALPPDFVAARALDLLAEGHARIWCCSYLIVRDQDQRIVGSCGFKNAPKSGRVEIGYGVSSAAQGQGAATAPCIYSSRPPLRPARRRFWRKSCRKISLPSALCKKQASRKPAHAMMKITNTSYNGSPVKNENDPIKESGGDDRLDGLPRTCSLPATPT